MAIAFSGMHRSICTEGMAYTVARRMLSHSSRRQSRMRISVIV